MLVVSELGQGIDRGYMGLGRLYQGKYVPPQRSDITHKDSGCDSDDGGQHSSDDKEFPDSDNEKQKGKTNDIDLD